MRRGGYVDHGIYVDDALPCSACRARTARRDETDPARPPLCMECDMRRQRAAGYDR